MNMPADQVFGNMTATLKAKGMYNNTLIVLTSDNVSPQATLARDACS
jgi:arylsulfatase A-like enzyme